MEPQESVSPSATPEILDRWKERKTKRPSHPAPKATGIFHKDLYRIKDVTEVLGVNKDTVNRWIRKGYLKAYRLPGRIGHVVAREHIEEFLAAHLRN